MKFTTALALILSFFLIGCQSEQKISNNCNYIDWFEQGRLDASSGVMAQPEKLALKRQCQLENKNQLEYGTGYNKGLGEYCSSENATALGRSGLNRSSICPLNLKPVFDNAYTVGLEIFELRKEQELLQGQIDNLFRLLTVQALSDLERDTLKEQLDNLESQQAFISSKLVNLQKKPTNRFIN